MTTAHLSPSSSLGDVGDGVDKPIFPLSDNDLSGLVRYDDPKSPCALYSRVDLPAGALLVRTTTLTAAPGKAYSSVQVASSPDKHIELNSALLYCNHSCSPSLEFRVREPIILGGTPGLDIHVSRKRSLKAGDELSFFYPSTEWDMARPFECLCIVSKNRPAELKGKGDERAGSKEYPEKCLGMVRGAKDISLDVLARDSWWLNEHILKRVNEKLQRVGGGME